MNLGLQSKLLRVLHRVLPISSRKIVPPFTLSPSGAGRVREGAL